MDQEANLMTYTEKPTSDTSPTRYPETPAATSMNETFPSQTMYLKLFFNALTIKRRL